MSFSQKIQRWVTEPAPEHLFEITETCLASAPPRDPAASRLHVLEGKSLEPSPSAPNLLFPQAYRDAIVRMADAGRKRNTAALVIPDYAVRMAIVDFEEFPQGEEERTALLRFRLRKSVPFHIEEAQVAYSVQLAEPKRIEVFAVAIARPILSEYETLFTEAGFRVGLVTPSSVAALPLYASAGSGLTLVAKLAGMTLSMLLLEQRRIRVVRSLHLQAGDDDPLADPEMDVVAGLQQTMAFAEDQIGSQVQRLLLCGFGHNADPLGRIAGKELNVPYAVVRSRFGAAAQENAGLLGLLEQYAA